jgi:D-amino-acid dehydrogenase
VSSPGPVVVVGGGIVGLSCAWFLGRAGAQVTVLEAGDRVGGGASRGNAGAICPSLAEPLPAPGMIKRALADMLRPDAALHVHPMFAPRMSGFLSRFARAARSDEYERGLLALLGLARGVTAAFDEMAVAGIGTHAGREGYLFAYRDPAAALEEHRHVARVADLGVCAGPGPILDGDGLRAIEPLLSDRVRAGFVLPGERWIDPGRLMDDLEEGVRSVGAQIVTGAAVTRIHDLGGEVEVQTGAGLFHGATAVLAAGAWTADLASGLGLRMPLLPGKGYSFALRPARMPERPLFLADVHVVATPMGERLRVAGTMEFDGTTDRFNRRRVDAIVRGVRELLPALDLGARTEEWVGPRPMTPDGLPLIGRLPTHPRVVIASGHNMLGVTLGPVTGRVVAAIVAGADAGIDLAAFAPDRFG